MEVFIFVSRSGPSPASLGAASMDGSYTTRATTNVVSGAIAFCFESMPQAPFPMDMELGKRTGYSTGTMTTDRSKLEE